MLRPYLGTRVYTVSSVYTSGNTGHADPTIDSTEFSIGYISNTLEYVHVDPDMCTHRSSFGTFSE